MNVLGLKIAGHDPGAAIVTSTGVVGISEERLSRIKHAHNIFPHASIRYCLDALGLSPKDIDIVALDPTPGRRGLTSQERFLAETKDMFSHARIVEVNHHDAHAATAFFCSPFEEAAVLVYDGAGDRITTNMGAVGFETETFYRGKGNTLMQISKAIHSKSVRRFPYTMGIGKLYSYFSTDYLSFGSNNEGKMMGLASYGDDRILREFPLENWVQEHNGQLVCNGQISFEKRISQIMRKPSTAAFLKTVYWGTRARIRQFLDSILRRFLAHWLRDVVGTPRIFTPIKLSQPARDPAHDKLPDQYYSAVAYAAQKIFEHFAITIGRHLKFITGSDNLCVAGGCGLNIDANRNYIDVVGFKNIFVQPASSDCGIPLGCALWARHIIGAVPRTWTMRSASLGRAYSDEVVHSALNERSHEITWQKTSTVAADAAALIADGNIIGWSQGGSEYGPRALGNRSILCDARKADMRDVLNSRVKHREMWRPFATSILAERLSEWFDLEPSATTAFMLLAAPVHAEKRSQVPSIVHVDGTCRMQTLTKEDNGVYYDLVHEFEKLTGVPLVLNTSFNLGGEPIVESPKDALSTFLRTDMDYLVIENYIIRKAGKVEA